MATSTWLAGFQMTTVEVTDLIAGSAYSVFYLVLHFGESMLTLA